VPPTDAWGRSNSSPEKVLARRFHRTVDAVNLHEANWKDMGGWLRTCSDADPCRPSSTRRELLWDTPQFRRRTAVPRCRHCHDDLPADSPPHVTSCRQYADWRARRAGDALPPEEADAVTVYAGLCAVQVGLRQALAELPDVR
jgi:hypothetical protein